MRADSPVEGLWLPAPIPGCSESSTSLRVGPRSVPCNRVVLSSCSAALPMTGAYVKSNPAMMRDAGSRVKSNEYIRVKYDIKDHSPECIQRVANTGLP